MIILVVYVLSNLVQLNWTYRLVFKILPDVHRRGIESIVRIESIQPRDSVVIISLSIIPFSVSNNRKQVIKLIS